ncbi:MAG: beta-lactamase [Gammaproteobacteria bacterium]|nr:beta-lactamase [Gammaproteobacteria bacterium]MBU1441771.1 beta-lactamase [Gammaproteobacteria bacterium]MBU2287418.1 beta-lactamase [Gammaproteobacteria bacterium]MBU2407270.1 beta-lactamase [Gammaproteobacteria bacterium]
MPTAATLADEDRSPESVRKVVEAAIAPLMEANDVPGVAVAVTVRGQHYFYDFGVASRSTGKRVDENTVFEIGSLSKTFTATLGAYAQALGKLSLSDRVTLSMPELAGSAFDKVTLRDLATYTAGGLPLQFPQDVVDAQSMLSYYKAWRPDYSAGAVRQYSNPSIGLFGHIVAARMGAPFDRLMEGTLFPMFGLSSSYIDVPARRRGDYADGHFKGQVVRVSPGVFASEAYGVKTTSHDMIKFVDANIDPSGLPPALRKAVEATHVGQYKVRGLTQGLGWEMYAWPARLEDLLAGNSSDMALKPSDVLRDEPPRASSGDVLINKTGSTNGFGAYAAFIPGRRIGIVLLANRNLPNAARVTAAHRVLTALE